MSNAEQLNKTDTCIIWITDWPAGLLCPLVVNVLWLFELLYHQLPSHFFFFSWRRRKKQYSSAFGEPESLLNLACLSSDIIFHLFQFPGARGTPHQPGSATPFQAEHSGIDWTDQGRIQLFASPVPQVSPRMFSRGFGIPSGTVNHILSPGQQSAVDRLKEDYFSHLQAQYHK